jgi:hypothetical protein
MIFRRELANRGAKGRRIAKEFSPFMGMYFRVYIAPIRRLRDEVRGRLESLASISDSELSVDRVGTAELTRHFA